VVPGVRVLLPARLNAGWELRSCLNEGKDLVVPGLFYVSEERRGWLPKDQGLTDSLWLM
jgi:hypothetical protein